MHAFAEIEGAVESEIECVEAIVEPGARCSPAAASHSHWHWLRTRLRPLFVCGYERVQLRRVMKLSAACIALQSRHALAAVGKKNIHRNAGGDSPDGCEMELKGRLPTPESTRRWRWSFGGGPYSSWRLLGRWAQYSKGIWSSLA